MADTWHLPTHWPRAACRLEEALGHIMDADLTLRSASNAPEMAVMERTLIRLAHLGAPRR